MTSHKKEYEMKIKIFTYYTKMIKLLNKNLFILPLYLSLNVM